MGAASRILLAVAGGCSRFISATADLTLATQQTGEHALRIGGDGHAIERIHAPERHVPAAIEQRGQVRPGVLRRICRATHASILINYVSQPCARCDAYVLVASLATEPVALRKVDSGPYLFCWPIGAGPFVPKVPSSQAKISLLKCRTLAGELFRPWLSPE